VRDHPRNKRVAGRSRTRRRNPLPASLLPRRVASGDRADEIMVTGQIHDRAAMDSPHRHELSAGCGSVRF
jgi:hypothetical protein